MEMMRINTDAEWWSRGVVKGERERERERERGREGGGGLRKRCVNA